MPKSRLDFWLPKLESNKERDGANRLTLKNTGWDVLILWECELKKTRPSLSSHYKFLGGRMRSVEIFVGAGGLAMGVSQAGFGHEAVVEWNKDACNTIRENQKRKVAPVLSWPLFECDVRKFDFACLPGGLDLLSSGPPCERSR